MNNRELKNVSRTKKEAKNTPRKGNDLGAVAGGGGDLLLDTSPLRPVAANQATAPAVTCSRRCERIPSVLLYRQLRRIRSCARGQSSLGRSVCVCGGGGAWGGGGGLCESVDVGERGESVGDKCLYLCICKCVLV